MRRRPALFLLSLLCLPPLAAQASPPPHAAAAPYTLRIPVDEISLTFHAAGPRGEPLTHLTRGDLRLTDNSKLQTSVVMLQEYDDLPIRAGFLFDTSASMLASLPFNRAVLSAYAS
ncbi:MAG TPA: hypothetical protein VL990_09825, partial [Acidobacteriaceae bacterium]|nr:hypothetical protein [Acidobacteriaceae bacterium]